MHQMNTTNKCQLCILTVRYDEASWKAFIVAVFFLLQAGFADLLASGNKPTFKGCLWVGLLPNMA